MPVPPLPSAWELPDPAQAPPGVDVIAIGADLHPTTLLYAYRRGLFPMHLGSGDLAWWSPDPRGVLPLDGLHVSDSLRKSMRKFTVTVDSAFVDVMRACGDPSRDGGWITPEFVQSYGTLHDMGWAHSVEVWNDGGELAGGLYGVEIGGLFAGESMFHRDRDASKVALVSLVERMVSAGGPRLLDVQWRTDHLASLGVVDMPRSDYLRALSVAVTLEPSFVEEPGDE